MNYTNEQNHLSRRRFAASLLFAGMAVVASILPAPVRADGLQILSSFTGGGATMRVAAYVEGAQTVGVVGVQGADNTRVSIAFDKKELATFVALVQKALALQSDKWVQAGSFAETQTTSPSNIVVYGGPSLQFSLTDPSIGSENFTLARGDISGFIAALQQLQGRVTDTP